SRTTRSVLTSSRFVTATIDGLLEIDRAGCDSVTPRVRNKGPTLSSPRSNHICGLLDYLRDRPRRLGWTDRKPGHIGGLLNDSGYSCGFWRPRLGWIAWISLSKSSCLCTRQLVREQWNAKIIHSELTIRVIVTILGPWCCAFKNGADQGAHWSQPR